MPSASDFPTQTVAPGLLSLLQIKRGANPSFLTDSLQATLDLREWMLSRERLTLAGSFAIAAGTNAAVFAGCNGSALATAIPVDEAWYLHNLTAVMFMGAGDTFIGQMCTAAQPAAGGTPGYFHTSGFTNVAGFGVMQVGGDVGRWFYGGTFFGIGYSVLTNVAGDTVQIFADVTRLKV